MKAKQLIKLLKKHPDWDILIASDFEGNSFSAMDSIGQQAYQDFDGEIQLGFTKLTKELEDRGYSEEDILENGKDCFIFWP